MAQNPVIGVAKDASQNGREVTLDFYLENLGDELLNSIGLPDDLDAVFGAGNFSIISPPSFLDDPGTITLNGSFDGSGDMQLISSGSLAVGDTALIRVVVRVDVASDVGLGFGIYNNQVTVAATGSMMVSDLSDDGVDPDPNGNGAPDDAGEDDPTLIDIVEIPIIGAAKNAALNGNQVTLDFYLENFGNRNLDNLSIEDDLDGVFGAGNYALISPPAFVDDPGTIMLNAAFNGSGVTELIASGSLNIADTAQIRVVVNITMVTDQGMGPGVYSNQVTAVGQSPAGTLTSDLSDSGNEPDSSGDNDPGDEGENDPTLFVFGQEPVIGAAKNATVNGIQVTLDFYLENHGNVALDTLSLPDNLDDVFGAGNYQIISGPVLIDDPGTLALNGSYDGSGNNELLAVSTLAIGDTAQIQVVVSVPILADLGLGLGNYRNQVTVTAQGTGGGVTSDLSDSGTDPDPNGNDDPGEAGENDPTDFSVGQIAQIGLAKTVTVLPASGAVIDVGGTPTVGIGPRIIITWYLENLGNVELSDITLTDDLDGVFGAGNYGTVISNQFPEILDSPGTIVSDVNYNGSTLPQVLAAGSTLSPGSLAVLRTEVIVTNVTDQGMGVGVYENQAMATGEGPGAVMTSDLSDSGTDPDANGNGDPNEAGEDDPTPFIVGSFIGVAKNATVNVNQVTLDFYLENFGTAQLDNISVGDNLDAVFGAGNYFISSVAVLVDDPGTIGLNGAFNGSDDTELLAAGSFLAGGDTAQLSLTVTLTKLLNRGNGFGVYTNSVLASAEQPGGAQLLDQSEMGTDPDPNGNGDPTELGENDPTVFTLTTDALVGVAKDANTALSQVTIDIYLENFGTMALTNLSLPENLDAVFGAGNYSMITPPSFLDDPGTLFLDLTFDGSANTDLLAAGSSLNGSDTAQIRFVVEVTNLVDAQGLGVGVYENQVTITGADPNGTILCDASDDGTDPDPDGDGDPTFPGLDDPPVPGEDDPTVIVIGESSIGIALHATVLGNDITMDVYIENLGDVGVTGLSLVDTLFTDFGFGNFSIASAPVLIDDPGTISIVTAFDGTFVATLISGGSLAPGTSAHIQFVVNIGTVTDQGNGLGVYMSQMLLNGLDPAGNALSDNSDDSIFPDGNGNGIASDMGEDDATLMIIGEDASLGVAKDAAVSGNQVTFDIYLENLGNVTLSDLVLPEDLDAVFGAGNYSLAGAPSLIDDPGTLNLDGAFDGSGNTALLAAGSTLAALDTAQIRLVVNVTNIVDQGLGVGLYQNQVWVGSLGPMGSVAMDLSTEGTDPDPNGDNLSSSAGESSPTGFTVGLPVVGVSKTASVSGNDVTFDFFVENLGTEILQNFSLQEGLDGIFGAGNYQLLSGPLLVSAPRDLVLNTNFDGSADTELIASGTVANGVLEQIRIVVRVLTLIDSGSGLGVYSNQVTVNAEDLSGGMTSDLSDDGSDPDPDGNGDPTDVGEDDVTLFAIVVNPVIGAAKTSAVVTHTVTLDLYLENHGNVPLSSLSLLENLDTTFGAGNYALSSPPMLIVDPGTLNLNVAFNGSGSAEILAAGSTLVLGATAQIRLVVQVLTVSDQGFGMGLYENQVTASGLGPVGAMTSDLSDAGTDPDPNGNDDPGEAGENDPTSITLAGNLGDFVWNDLNGDGIQDGGEPGLVGVTLFLDLNSNGMLDGGEPTETTAAGGAYDFSDLAAGSYSVRVDPTTLPADFNLTTANIPLAVNLAVGDDFDTADFGYQQQNATIGDFVWNDLSGDGIQDAGEPGLAGIAVYLDLNSNGVLDGGEPSDTTDGSGAYDIADLATGSYSVRVDAATVPAGFVLITANLPLAVNLAVGEDFDGADFGYQQQDATIGDFVWHDLNGDGVQDPGEPGFQNVTLDLSQAAALLGGGGVLATQTTDGNGFYDFAALATGNYSVLLTDTNAVLDGFIQTGGAANPSDVPLAAGQDENAIDFGFCLPLQITDEPESLTLCVGEQAAFSVAAIGSGNISYQWIKDGVDLLGESMADLIIPAVTLADVGIYECFVQNGCGSELTISVELGVDELSVDIVPSSLAQGLLPVSLDAVFECEATALTWEWENLNSGIMFGMDQNPVTLGQVLTETTVIEITTDDDLSVPTSDVGLILVADDLLFLDLNGDGCNNIEDIWFLAPLWRQFTVDANSDGFIDVIDFIYINTVGDCLVP